MFRLFATILVVGIMVSGCNKNTVGYLKTSTGIELTIKESDQNIKLSVDILAENIARIRSTIKSNFSIDTSLVVNAKTGYFNSFEVIDSSDFILLKTDKMVVKVNKNTGSTSFYDANGNLKLAEKVNGGKLFSRDEIDQRVNIGQIFESPEEEALYGLGQHQHGYMNYKGKNVDLTQHNIVAVVPFLYSSKNYGLLWDNASITKFGNPKDFKHLSDLNLKDKDGKKGGLTETWYKDNVQVGEKLINAIDYQYLETESYLNLPTPNEVDKIIFEGKISSDIGGKRELLLYASSYFKLWIDGELHFDKWRQNWNPWSNPFDLNMEAGKEYHLKIEWIPNFGYLSLTHLDPINSEEQNRITLTSEAGDDIDYYYIDGEDADEVIHGYRTLTGKSRILPKSAYGYWQSRERYKTQDEILQVANEYRSREIPIDNIVLDWSYWPEDKWGSHEFDAQRFPDPEAMNNQLKSKYDLDIMISVWPKYYKGTKHYNEMKSKGFLFLNNINEERVDWIAKGYLNTFYDVFNTGARNMFWDQLDEHLYSKGFHSFWLDATEPDMHSNLSIKDRLLNMEETALGEGNKYFNTYSLMNSKAVFEGQMKSHPDERVFILTRSAFAGQQRYGSVTWSGDVVSRWSDFKDQISAGVNFSLSGIPNWTMDIGGFAVEDRYSDDNKRTGSTLDEWRELNTRWFQFGAFCPIFRSHGQYPYREIYNIAPKGHPAYESMVYYDKLRYKLMPHIYSLGAQTYFDDFTIMRGLVMDFPKDKNTYDIADQYMFGTELMICPVTEMGQKKRSVYLPEDTYWYDLYTGNQFEGGKQIIANAPYDKMPIFVKEGSILITGKDIKSSKDSNLKQFDIYVYEGKDGSFVVYDDNGINNDYLNGNYSKIKIDYDDQNRILKLASIEGDYYANNFEHNISVHYITKDNPLGIDMLDQNINNITYRGKALSIKL